MNSTKPSKSKLKLCISILLVAVDIIGLYYSLYEIGNLLTVGYCDGNFLDYFLFYISGTRLGNCLGIIGLAFIAIIGGPLLLMSIDIFLIGIYYFIEYINVQRVIDNVRSIKMSILIGILITTMFFNPTILNPFFS